MRRQLTPKERDTRDMFAGLAMQSLIRMRADPLQHMAQEAYDVAEAMMQEREDRDGDGEEI